MSENASFQPSREHEWLNGMVGTWDVECAYFTIPGEEPIEIEGREVAEIMGPFWLLGRFEADMMGTPLAGQSVTGYDPVKKLFIGTWKDNFTPFHYTYEGTLSEDEKTLVLEGENYDPTRQCMSIYRNRTEYLHDSERIMALSVDVDGSEVPILEYRYKRK